MSLPTIYHYDRATKALTGQGIAAQDPLASTAKKPVYLIPANATDVEPPAATAGMVAVFDADKGTWSEVEDHRGTKVYDTTNGLLSIIADLGPIPAGQTDLAPEPFQTWDAASAAWIDDMPALQASLNAYVDAQAEAARGRHVTTGAAQSMVYVDKAAEADAYKAAGYPADTTAYPMLAAEATATNQTAQQIADGVIAARDAWKPIAGSIEAIRIPAKTAINAAVDRATAQTAHDNAVTALSAV